jgi:glycopeptide antibiotics resistance protein
LPFQDIAADPGGALEIVGDLLLLVPLGMLAALWRWPVWDRVRPLAPSLAAGMVIILGIEVSQLFVRSRYSSVTDLLTGSLGVLIGWGVANWLVRSNAKVSSDAGSAKARGLLLFAFAALYLLIVGALLCFPIDRWAASEEAQVRLSSLLSRPLLASLYHGSELNAVTQILRKVLLFVPLGGLLVLAAHARWPAASRRPGALAAVALVAVAGAAAIELLQVWLPPHIPDFTDTLLATLGAILGMAAVLRVLSDRHSATA